MRRERGYHRSEPVPGTDLVTYLVRVREGDKGPDVPPGYYLVATLRGHGKQMRSMAGPSDHALGLTVARRAAHDHQGLYRLLRDFMSELSTSPGAPEAATLH